MNCGCNLECLSLDCVSFINRGNAGGVGSALVHRAVMQRMLILLLFLGTQYQVLDVVGEGAYGIVCSAVHRPSGRKVAIKKIAPFDHSMFCLRTLRELKLLKYLSEAGVSENVSGSLSFLSNPPSHQIPLPATDYLHSRHHQAPINRTVQGSILCVTFVRSTFNVSR